MSAPLKTQIKTQHLHIRVTEQEKQTLTQAVRLKNLSLSQFLLQAALPHAEEIVNAESPTENGNVEGRDVQTIFALEEESWREFQRRLEAPPRALPELQKLLRSQPVWES